MPDGRVDDLAAHAVAVLVGQAGVGVPAAPVQLVEVHAQHGDLLGRLARRGHQAHGHRASAIPGITKQVAGLVVVAQVRGPVAERRVDVVDVAVRRLGDVRVGREDRHDLVAFSGRA